MTRKHFQAIAFILRSGGASTLLVNLFCAYFLAENPRFDAAKFRAAVSGRAY
ncbi:hypothetical protein UFOVP965_109 [uncultured Caudovirales phage]|uniref:Uncharacterized protein n=1 Tax=uncultured Caudovirales phage TaxID=2100421 RepID=A0A6J5QF92_9CAUD|nr:hypothetical protein UFOVP965_109 [uncultured Caudovirales phage]CAB4179898.1 hypothetical protein UFOVP1035_105 [uncultured Caudovirales phage]CAB4188718.1 hypothetical protein UFOVP1181_64 [uncultured Caudovirales phage]